MEKKNGLMKDDEVFDALSKASKLYEDYLIHENFSQADIYDSGRIDFFRDMSYPLGLIFKE